MNTDIFAYLCRSLPVDDRPCKGGYPDGCEFLASAGLHLDLHPDLGHRGSNQALRSPCRGRFLQRINLRISESWLQCVWLFCSRERSWFGCFGQFGRTLQSSCFVYPALSPRNLTSHGSQPMYFCCTYTCMHEASMTQFPVLQDYPYHI